MKIVGARRDPRDPTGSCGGDYPAFPWGLPGTSPRPRPRVPSPIAPRPSSPRERGWRQMLGGRDIHSRSWGSRARRAWGWLAGPGRVGPGCRVPAHLPQRQEGLPEIHGPGEEQHGAEDALLGRQLPQRLQRRPRPHGHGCGPVLGVLARESPAECHSDLLPSRARPHLTPAPMPLAPGTRRTDRRTGTSRTGAP